MSNIHFSKCYKLQVACIPCNCCTQLMALFVQSLGALGGISRSLFVPFLRNHLCGEDIEVASQIPKLYQRVHGELFGC